jgi:hypothetical protein
VTARDTYTHLAWQAGHHERTGLGAEAAAALDEIDRLRALLAQVAPLWTDGDMSQDAQSRRLFAAMAYGGEHQDLIEELACVAVQEADQ